MSYIVQTQYCYIATKWAKKKICIIGCFPFKRLNLSDFCMTPNCSNHKNMELKICMHGLFMCVVYSPTAHHTSYALRNPSIHMSKVLSYGNSNVRNFREYMPITKGMCLSRELRSLFFKKLNLEKHPSSSTLPRTRTSFTCILCNKVG